MGGQYNWLECSPEEIIQTIEHSTGKIIAAELFERFITNGLTYKVRAQAKYKNAPDGIGYTVHFYIWKSKESIIMNTNPFKVQLRIHDQGIFEKLDDYSENVRKAILIDSVRSPNNDYDDGSYIFTYHGNEYRLCYQLSENFKFPKIMEEDHDSIMDIVNRNIATRKQPKGATRVR